MGRFRIRQTNLDPADYLFHYTSGAGLLGIVTSGYLRASHHRFMNDASEVGYGFQAVRRLLSQIVERELGNPDSKLRQLATNGWNFETSAAAFTETIRTVLYSTLGGYLSCLCSHTQPQAFEHGLLSQWRGYGANGGYAIRFKLSALRTYLDGVAAASQGVTAYLDKVRYGHTERPLSSGLTERMREKMLAYIEAPLANRRSVGIEEFADMESIEEMLDYSLFTKNDHFAEENEWRIAATCAREITDGLETYYVRDGDIVPCLELRSTIKISECIEGVLVGPHPYQDERCESVTRLLASHGCKVPVDPTGIPLRG